MERWTCRYFRLNIFDYLVSLITNVLIYIGALVIFFFPLMAGSFSYKIVFEERGEKMQTKVSITKIKNRDNISLLKETLVELLTPFGGIEGIIKEKNQVILLKPNLVAPVDYTKGATTNPYLIKALIELIKGQQPEKIIIADGASVGTGTEEVLKATGYLEMFSSEIESGEVEIVDFKKGPFILKEVPGGKVLKELRVPELLYEVDIIINLPVLKTHDALPVTLGLKNMKGIIHESDKKRFHRIGLSQAVVDLNKVLLADFTIYDGTVAMEGLGPVHGEAVNLGLLLATKDVVAGDLVAASIMGFKKEELDFVKLAEEQGLGKANFEEIDIYGPEIDGVRRPFKRYSVTNSFYQGMGIEIKGDKGCSGCRHTFDSIMRKLNEKMMEALKNKTIYLGPVDEITGKKEQLILVGSCLHLHRGKGYYIKGCPPHPEDLIEFLENEVG